MAWRGKTSVVVLLAQCAMFWACPPRHHVNADHEAHLPCFEKRRLTQKLIDEYNITPHDLMQLQFYLENRIVLHRKQASRTKKVTADHKLDLHKKIAETIIEFPDGVPGKPDTVLEAFGIPQPRYLIKIRFENDPRICLTFSAPLWRGGFILKKSFMLYEIEYGGHKYQCEDWDRPHFLLVCMREIIELKTTRRIAPGVRFEDNF